MKKKLTMEQWITACKKVIDTGNCEDLQKVLGYLNEGDRYMAFPYQREIVKYAAEKDEIRALRTILEHEKFMGMGVHLLKDALDQDSECLLELALDYVNPNALVHDEIFRPDEKEDEGPLAMFGEGVRYYVTAEPLGICAIQGKVKLAEILLERGARPNGSTAEDTMNNNAQMIRPFSYTKVEIHRRWKKDGWSMIEYCAGLKRLPPWAYGMYCSDIKAAEFFLSLGEDRYTLELAMAVSMVSDGEIIRILQEQKPKLMAALDPKFILRRFWPEAVEQYFSAGRKIPSNAVELMGTYLFEEHDIDDDQTNPLMKNLREEDFVDTLKYLLKHGYRLTQEDVERLIMWMVLFRSERLLNILKGKIPQGMDVSPWIDYLPLDEKAWEFGKKLVEAGIRFRCVIDKDFKCYRTKRYMELTRLFKLVEFEIRQPELLDCMSASVLFTRSKRSMALLWKQGLINKQNLTQAVKLICELQLTELYEFSAELAGTTGGSEVRYEL